MDWPLATVLCVLIVSLFASLTITTLARIAAATSTPEPGDTHVANVTNVVDSTKP